MPVIWRYPCCEDVRIIESVGVSVTDELCIFWDQANLYNKASSRYVVEVLKQSLENKLIPGFPSACVANSPNRRCGPFRRFCGTGARAKPFT